MAKKFFRATTCTFSKELRQRQIIRGLGLTAVTTLVITAHLQQNGILRQRVTPHNTAAIQAESVMPAQSILSDYTPQTVAAVSQATPPIDTSIPLNKLPPYWSVESVHAKGSFEHAAEQSGLTHAELIGLNDIFSDKVNFKHLHAGDQFKVLTERVPGTANKKPRDKIIAAEFISGHNKYTAIRYQNPKTQQVSYYQTNGMGLTASFLRYPTHYTRIGSGFLWHRLDPVTGAYHSHPGVDFDAPMNNPITATADGTIYFMAYEQGYGNVVKINHSGQVSTLYAHMNHFAAGLHAGSTVKKGEVIGYVGMTGYATGPHVHYELHFGGSPVDPLTAKLPSTNMIASSQKTKFMQQAKAIGRILDQA